MRQKIIFGDASQIMTILNDKKQLKKLPTTGPKFFMRMSLRF